MSLTGLHFLLTYRCTFECDHCFVWGGPDQSAAITLPQLTRIFDQAEGLKTIRSVAFEGGEPFLYYGTLLEAVRQAHDRGWSTTIVTNGYWATSAQDALAALEPLRAAGLDSLMVSEDAFHGSVSEDKPSRVVCRAARRLDVPLSVNTVRSVEETLMSRSGRSENGSSSLRFRGRAAVRLTAGLEGLDWWEFTACTDEDLAHPGRVHIDPLGFVHLCQGLVLGNLWSKPLPEMMAAYQPERHPICGPLIRGGPAALARAFDMAHHDRYVDACHMCYDLRSRLRERAPHWLAPGQMYGDLS